MDDTSRTPWAKIAEDPTRFFDSDCYPVGFRFEDPSRMGKTVKDLLKHLRQRQEELGVNAFRFDNYLKDKKFYPAQYPDHAQSAINAGAEVKYWPIPVDIQPSASLTSKEQIVIKDEEMQPSLMAADTATPTPVTFYPTPTPTPVDTKPTPATFNPIPTPAVVNLTPSHASGSMTAAPVVQNPRLLSVNPIPTSVPTPLPGLDAPLINGVLPQGPSFPVQFPFSSGIPMPYAQYFTQVQESGKFMLDPRLWNETGGGGTSTTGISVPPGDPFAHLKLNLTAQSSNNELLPQVSAPTSLLNPDVADTTVTTSRIKIKPPIFSPASTPSRSPRKRPRDSDARITPTPTNNRPRRNIITPKKYADNAFD